MSYWARCLLCISALIFNAGCITLVSAYDPFFDQSLNKFAEDTAKFTAAAEAGGPERQYASPQTTAYYAASYNLLDRLAARARATRGPVPCPTNASLATFAGQPTSVSRLPEDYTRFDCREFQLASVRFYLDQLKYGHASGNALNGSEARALGTPLQTAILGAIQTFTLTKS